LDEEFGAIWRTKLSHIGSCFRVFFVNTLTALVNKQHGVLQFWSIVTSTANIQWATVSDECLSSEYFPMGIEHVNLQDTEAH
jgi:hypothetical protein